MLDKFKGGGLDRIGRREKTRKMGSTIIVLLPFLAALLAGPFVLANGEYFLDRSFSIRYVFLPRSSLHGRVKLAQKKTILLLQTVQ